MTIHPDNKAPKFQDPAETPDRKPESRKPDAEKNKVERQEPDGRHGVSDSAVKSPQNDAPGVKQSPENEAPAVKETPAVQQSQSPENKAAAAKQSPSGSPSPENKAPVAARTRLFEDQDVTRYREQWRELQAGFVDEPRGAVREADTLVSQMMDALTSQLAEQKRTLKGESDAEDTEQLRVALQRYRSLFDQMLQV